MKQFLREHWLYVVAPLALVLLLLAALLLFGDDSVASFIYNV